MSITKFLFTVAVFATFGLVACGDDSSSVPTNESQKFEPSGTDEVACSFKTNDDGFKMVVTIADREVNTIVGSCDKEACEIKTFQEIDGVPSANQGSESHIYSLEKDAELVAEGKAHVKAWFENRENFYENGCKRIDGGYRKNYDDFILVLDTNACDVVEDTDTRFVYFMKEGEMNSTFDVTIAGDTVTTYSSKPFDNGKKPEACSEKKDEKSNTEITCDDTNINKNEVKVYESEEKARQAFDTIVKGGKALCSWY